jgi:DNA-directed RNA polymerase specialized sigma24 family protein
VGDGDDAPKVDEAAIGQIFREESGRSVAALIRDFGDIDVAEDAVQEAFAVALNKWPGEGLPPNPGGWITTTARNRAIDRLRRESRGRELLSEVAMLSPGNDDPVMPEEVEPVQDARLRLVFTCCHPALSTEAQVALTLRLLGGLSTRRWPGPSSSPSRPWLNASHEPSARSRRRGSPTACRKTMSCPTVYAPCWPSSTSSTTPG